MFTTGNATKWSNGWRVSCPGIRIPQHILIFEWKITGLECMDECYIKAFANNQIDGRQLLNLRPYELEELGIPSVGHQEIILEAVEHLKNFVSLFCFYFYQRPEITKLFCFFFSFSIIISIRRICNICRCKSVRWAHHFISNYHTSLNKVWDHRFSAK